MDKSEKLLSVLREQLGITVDEDLAARLLRLAQRGNVGGYIQWMSSDEQAFFPASQTHARLAPGVYSVQSSMERGLYFDRMQVSTEGLLRLPDTNSDRVIEEIQNFWSREQLFRDYNLTYKRGILLHGPPGSGKTATLRIITADVISKGGLVIPFSSPGLVATGLRILREIQPDTPVVVLMEDLDSIIDSYVESDVINLLDGVTLIDKVLFLATTNYPERLQARVVNRPSRFDRRFYIGPPNEESRKLFFNYLFAQGVEKPEGLALANMPEWVRDTEGMSIAHLKELFVAVVILGTPYAQAIEILRSMDQIPNSDSYGNDGEEVADSGEAYAEACVEQPRTKMTHG